MHIYSLIQLFCNKQIVSEAGQKQLIIGAVIKIANSFFLVEVIYRIKKRKYE